MERVDKQYDEEYEDKFEDLVDLTFNSFVLALKELRSEGILQENVFLSVLSTDPSDHMLELEKSENKGLNSSELYSKWEAWCEQYN